jgi:hypothetical protein
MSIYRFGDYLEMTNALNPMGPLNVQFNQPIPTLDSLTNSIMLSDSDKRIVYGDEGGIINPYARDHPGDMRANTFTIIPELSSTPIGGVQDPQARRNSEVKTQEIEIEILGVRTNYRSIAVITGFILAIYLIQHS